MCASKIRHAFGTENCPDFFDFSKASHIDSTVPIGFMNDENRRQHCSFTPNPGIHLGNSTDLAGKHRKAHRQIDTRTLPLEDRDNDTTYVTWFGNGAFDIMS